MIPLVELAAGRATPALHALCPTTGFVAPRCRAVLTGAAAGRILTDDPRQPTWAAVQEFSDAGVLFLAGALSRDLVAELIHRLRRAHEVTVGVTNDDLLRSLLPADWDEVGEDIVFTDRDPAVDLPAVSQAWTGLRLERIDTSLLPRCAWPPWLAADDATALALGLGYCLLDGRLVVAEAFAGPLVDGELEMATITHPAYRRRGLAAVVCARTIVECERRGNRTWWNAARANVGSVRLARRLGYRTERPYQTLIWRSSG